VRHPLGGRGVPRLEIGPDQAILAAERAVQRCFRDPGALDDPVDADRLHAFGIEQLAGGGQQPRPRRRTAFLR
jgi:hypothetical protein